MAVAILLRQALAGSILSSGQGSVLFETTGGLWVALNFGTTSIAGNAAQAPTVAQAHLFVTDATALTANRTITPSTVGVSDRESISFIVKVPTASGGFFYQLAADVTLNLSQPMWVDLVFRDSAWQLSDWKPLTAGL